MPRLAVIDRDKCIRDQCGYLCEHYCPVVRMGSPAVFIEQETGYPVIDEILCTGCGICVHKCPTQAISVINLVSEAGILLHQYGKNSFRLYNSALPKEGSVVGLIGRNGLGKSTMVKILANQLIPNMGNLDSEPSWDNVLSKFKGNEVVNFFMKLRDKQAKLSYKPQEIDLIPKVFSGTVRDALASVNPELVDQFNLTHLLDRNVKDLSGGELQRLALCLSLSKDADVYFIDEPTSYLDIRERLYMAKLIRKFSESSSVFVVEHDLSVLDFLSDFIHVVYGVPGVYGVISAIKSSRNGINEYLQGYLKNENVRFRDFEIRFKLHNPNKEKRRPTMDFYDSFDVNLGDFKLHASSGDVKIGEVIGIVGPNGIGKTTFVNYLAEHLSATVAYKPQYLREKYTGMVDSYVKSDILDVNKLLGKPIDTLSGGELQRLAIAHTLESDAQIYLFDEPSAFLDVEYRLESAQLIRDFVNDRERSAFVIDHDLVFLDMVADRIIVFTGVPGTKGRASEPMSLQSGMNLFLKDMGITFRRDPQTLRPRANKPNSQKDQLQKSIGEYYYFKTGD